MEEINSVGIDEQDVLQFGDNTYKVSSLLKKLQDALSSRFPDAFVGYLKYANINIPLGKQSGTQDLNNSESVWVDEGVPCEALKLGSSVWQTGRVRVRFVVEYVADETIDSTVSDRVSSLDDIRQMVGE
jgi:hypothetical protein